MTLSSPDFLGINLYNFFWASSWLLGFGIFAWLRAGKKEKPLDTFLLGAGIFVSAVFGGRVFYFLNHPEKSVWQSFSSQSGGLVLWGSIIFVVFFLFLATQLSPRSNRMRFWDSGNDLALSAAPALALGRWGCFFQGCCHGKLCPFSPASVIYSSPFSSAEILGQPLYAVQVIESIGIIAIFLAMLRLKSKADAGLVFLTSYALLRFGLEFLRGDQVRGHFGLLSSSQIVSLVVFLLVCGLYFFGRKELKKP